MAYDTNHFNWSPERSFATTVVAHQSNFNKAKGLALNIRSGMEKGIFE